METIKQEPTQEPTQIEQFAQVKDFWLDEIQNVDNDHGHSYIPLMGEFRASMLPYCGRKNILRKNPDWIEFEVIDTPKSTDPMALGSNHIGHAIHNYVQDKLLNKNINIIAIEPNVYTNFNEMKIEGHIDLLALFPDGLRVIDIKTFLRKENYNIENYLPNAHHIEQLSIYMGITRVQKASLLYINRNDFEPLFYDFDWKIPFELKVGKNETEVITMKEIYRRLIDKAIALQYHERKQTLPDKLPKKFNDWKKITELNWECNYCEFTGYCFPNGADQ